MAMESSMTYLVHIKASSNKISCMELALTWCLMVLTMKVHLSMELFKVMVYT